MDGNQFDIPPWTSRSEGAATIITGMIDPTIAGLYLPTSIISCGQLTAIVSDSTGSFLNQNAVADDELHSHIQDEKNWDRLWDVSAALAQEQYPF